MLPSASTTLTSISPSRLERLACPARVAFEQLGAGGSSQQLNAPAIRGQIAHRALELVALGAEVDAAWEKALTDAARGGVDVEAVPELRRTGLRYRRRARDLQELLVSVGRHRPHAEVELQTADGLVRGCADLVLERSDDLVIIDHKAGVVLAEDRPKASYVRQVQLYAVMAEAHFRKTVSEGILLSLRDGRVAVDVDPASLVEAERSARAAVDAFNAAVPGAQIAAPSPSRCRFCPYTARCDGFWEAAGPGWIDEVGIFVRGVVMRAEVAANGLGSLEIEVADQAPNDRVHVSGIPSQLIEQLEPAEPVSLTGLGRHPRDAALLVWGAYGRIAAG